MQQYHQKKKNKKEGKHNCYIILPSSWLRLIVIYHKVLPCNLLPNVYFQLKSITQNSKAQEYLNHPHQNQQEVTEDEDFWNNLHISMEEQQSEHIWQPNCKSMNKKTL